MSKIKQTRQRAADLYQQAQTLAKTAAAESRDMTADESAQFDALMDKHDAAMADVRREERLLDAERALAASSTESPAAAQPIEVRELDVERPFASLGDFLLSVARAGMPTAVVDRRLLPLAGPSGANTSVPSEGGYLVHKDFSSILLDKAVQESLVWQDCTEVPIGPDSDGVELVTIDETSRANGSRWGGVQVYRRSEADTVTATKPTFGKLTIDLEDIMGLAYVTERQLRDGSSLAAIVSKAFASEFAFRMDDEVINGTGNGQCLGIMQSGALATVSKESAQTGTFVAANAAKMLGRMPARLISGAKWYINQEVLQQLTTMTLGNQPIYLQAGTIASAPYGMLLGRPVVPIEQASALGTKGDVILANFGEYLVATKGGLEQADSMHVRFIYAERAFRWLARNNGAPAWKSALTPYKGSAALSPFVVVENR